MNKILPIILVVVLSGCATVQTLKFEKTSKSIPLLDEISEVRTGDRLVLVSDYKIGEGIEVKSDINWSQLGVFQRIHFTIASGEKEFLIQDYTAQKCYGFFNEYHLLCVRKDSKEMFVRFCPSLYSSGCDWGLDDYEIQNKYEYQIINMQVEDKNKELIYSGKVENIIRFLYRENRYGVDKAPFVQEVQFDLRDSDIIEFKGLRIDVVEASNQSIKYKVIRYFSVDPDADITE